MDDNKLKTLKAVDYLIQRCCGICVHSKFPNPTSDFGTCSEVSYRHKKHTGPPRNMSVLRFGVCQEPLFDLDHKKLETFGAFSQFF